MKNENNLTKFSAFCFLFIFLVIFSIAVNAKGILDKSFGTNGIVTLDSSGYSVVDIQRQSDGKIVILTNRYSLIRFNPDGSLDTSFGTNGTIITRYGRSFLEPDYRVSFTLQSDGLFAVGDNRSVTRYNSTGTIIEEVAFPYTKYTAFGFDGKIATAYILPNQNCLGINQNKINYALYNRDGTFIGSTQFCTAGSGSTGITAIWGIVPNRSNNFYIGYNHRTLNTSNGFVAEMSNTPQVIQSTFVDPGGRNPYFQIVDLAVPENGGFVAAGHYNIVRFENNTAKYFNFTFGNTFADTPTYYQIHAYQKIAALKANQMLVLNSDFSFAGFENTTRFFDILNQVYVQPDDKIIVAGQVSSNPNPSKIRLVRYSNAYNHLANLIDYDGDGKSDVSVFRPSTGNWVILNSSNNAERYELFGSAGDKIVPADYDDDGKTDVAVFRPSNGTWYLQQSMNGFSGVQFGQNGDIPVPADYDGDGKADIAVYRPSTGSWYRLNSSTGQFFGIQFGAAEDKPTIGDFDGDGKADIAVYRPSDGGWYRIDSSTGRFFGRKFGVEEDIPTPADYDADGKTDISVFRPSTGGWYRINSSVTFLTSVAFGMSGDKPVAADYDGDGKADIAVYRPSDGRWYIQRSTAGYLAYPFGVSEDVPTPNAFLR